MMQTRDLWFSAYLRMKGYKLLGFDIISKGRGSFHFEISDKQWKEEKLLFIESETSKVKQIIEELKDLVY